jgi:hypothetical protein
MKRTELKRIIKTMLVEEAKSPADARFLKAFDKSFIQELMNQLGSVQDQWSYDDSPNLSGTIRNRKLIKTLDKIYNGEFPFDGQIVKITNAEDGEIVIAGNDDGVTLYKNGKSLDDSWLDTVLSTKGSSEVESFTTWISRGDEANKAFRKRSDREQNPDERGQDPARTAAVKTMTEKNLREGLSIFLAEATKMQDEIVDRLLNENKSLTYVFQEMINDFGEEELSDYWIRDRLNKKLG